MYIIVGLVLSRIRLLKRIRSATLVKILFNVLINDVATHSVFFSLSVIA